MTVQVRSDLYGFNHRDAVTRFVQYTGIHRGAPELKAIEKAKPLKPRVYPSLVNFMDSYIFVSGGEEIYSTGTYLSSMNVFIVAQDRW